MDIWTQEKRSKVMSRILSRNTLLEQRVRRILSSMGYRYRLNVDNLPGKPDIVLPKYKTVIFIHGCFWHGHKGCKYFTVPKTRTKWWLKKIMGNKQRDLDNFLKVRKEGWKVISIFECKLKIKKRDKTFHKLLKKFK